MAVFKTTFLEGLSKKEKEFIDTNNNVMIAGERRRVEVKKGIRG